MKRLTAFIKKQLAIGSKIEMEHTKSKKVAKKIAMEHIAEFEGKPYYSELVKMEKRLKNMTVVKK